MLTFLFGLMAIIICLAAGMMVGLVIFGVLFVLMILCVFAAESRKKQIAKMQPSERICPMCKGTNIKFKYITEGTSSSKDTVRSSRTHARVRPNGRGTGTTVGVSTTNGNTQIHHRNMAYCGDCGYTFDFTTQEDIDAEYKAATNSESSSVLGAIVCGVLFCVIWRFMNGQS